MDITKQKKVPETSGVSDAGVKWTLISETKSQLLDTLFDIYSKNRKHCKIYFETNKDFGFAKRRVVLFEHPNGDFDIISYNRKYGISKTAVMYNRENVNMAVRYRGGKFYFAWGSKFTQLCYSSLSHFSSVDRVKIDEFLEGRFAWLRNVKESSYMHNTSLTVINQHKLFNEKKYLRFRYKTSYNIARVVMDRFKFYRYGSNTHRFWIDYRDTLCGLEHFNPELSSCNLFEDTVVMAKTLGYVVNCSWSVKRIKIEHDKWAKEIVAVLLEYEPYRDLKIHQIYRDFAAFSGYELLESNHDLIEEGKVMGHCVGTYSATVDAGTCAIFRVNGCTLDLRFGAVRQSYDYKILYMSQYMAFANVRADVEKCNEVNSMIDRFNREVITPEYLKAFGPMPSTYNHAPFLAMDDLNPF